MHMDGNFVTIRRGCVCSLTSVMILVNCSLFIRMQYSITCKNFNFIMLAYEIYETYEVCVLFNSRKLSLACCNIVIIFFVLFIVCCRRHVAAVINGRALAKQVKDELRAEVKQWVSAGHRAPCLTAVLVGNAAASDTYVRHKVKAADYIGSVLCLKNLFSCSLNCLL